MNPCCSLFCDRQTLDKILKIRSYKSSKFLPGDRLGEDLTQISFLTQITSLLLLLFPHLWWFCIFNSFVRFHQVCWCLVWHCSWHVYVDSFSFIFEHGMAPLSTFTKFCRRSNEIPKLNISFTKINQNVYLHCIVSSINIWIEHPFFESTFLPWCHLHILQLRH